MIFYPGLHQPGDAQHFARAMMSIRRLKKRKKKIPNVAAIIDSGAFRELELHGDYQHEPEEYGAQLRRLHDEKILIIDAAVTQDYMCEPFMLAKTGKTVLQHQELTVERYDALMACDLPVYVMPVLQGYEPEEYVRHIRMYGDRLKPGMWVGVGSICKRNGKPSAILAVLRAIKAERPDLRIHAFGLKIIALSVKEIRDLVFTSDSMAWSFAARYEGRDANDWREAKRYEERIALDHLPPKTQLEFTL